MIRGTKPPEGVGSPSTNLWKWKTPKAISRNVTWQLTTWGLLPWIPMDSLVFFQTRQRNDGFIKPVRTENFETTAPMEILLRKHPEVCQVFCHC